MFQSVIGVYSIYVRKSVWGQISKFKYQRERERESESSNIGCRSMNAKVWTGSVQSLAAEAWILWLP